MNRCLGWMLVLVVLTAVFSPAMADEKGMPEVLIETTKGDIVIALDAQAAPATVANFLDYVKKGYYSGTIFHRVIKDFMIQGGGLETDMSPKPAFPPIKNEADNGLKNRVGTIAMARTSDPHSATTQFFINTRDNAALNHRSKTSEGWGYCVFGKVIKGMETVRAIENTPTGSRAWYQDVPLETIIIKRMSVLK